ncbi:MAG: large repetitive protein [Thermoanaerobaculia bacterium]|nr:large repetitive protein [Thermoanaerobaculia bacterium]
MFAEVRLHSSARRHTRRAATFDSILITVAVVGDTLVENTDTFKVQLTNPVNATFDDSPLLGSGVGTILGRRHRRAAGARREDRQRRLPGRKQRSVQRHVHGDVIGGIDHREPRPLADAGRNATAGQDYTASSGELVFQPGKLTKTLTVSVIGDGVFEPDEFFTIVIVSTGNTSVVPGPAATGIIINDDIKPPSHRRPPRP